VTTVVGGIGTVVVTTVGGVVLEDVSTVVDVGADVPTVAGETVGSEGATRGSEPGTMTDGDADEMPRS
jgi:hypothetical protein